MSPDFPILRSLFSGSLNVTHLLSVTTADSGERFPFVLLTKKLQELQLETSSEEIDRKIESILKQYVQFNYVEERRSLPNEDTIRLRREIGSNRKYAKFSLPDFIHDYNFITTHPAGAAPKFIYTAVQAELRRTRLMIIASMEAFQDDERSLYMLIDSQKQLLSFMKTSFQRYQIASTEQEKTVFQSILHQLLQSYSQHLWLFLLSRPEWKTRIDLPNTLEAIVDDYSLGAEYPPDNDIAMFNKNMNALSEPYLPTKDYLQNAIDWTMSCERYFAEGIDKSTIIAIWNEIDSDPGLQLRKKLTNSSKYVVICGFLGLAKNNIFISKNTHKLTNLQLAECLPIQDDKPIKIESAERLISKSLSNDTYKSLRNIIINALKKIPK